MTLAEQLERSTQIPLQALVAIGREAQTTLDQRERIASKSQKLEGTRLQRARLPRVTIAVKPDTSSATAPTRTSIYRQQQ